MQSKRMQFFLYHRYRHTYSRELISRPHQILSYWEIYDDFHLERFPLFSDSSELKRMDIIISVYFCHKTFVMYIKLLNIN